MATVEGHRVRSGDRPNMWWGTPRGIQWRRPNHGDPTPHDRPRRRLHGTVLRQGRLPRQIRRPTPRPAARHRDRRRLRGVSPAARIKTAHRLFGPRKREPAGSRRVRARRARYVSGLRACHGAGRGTLDDCRPRRGDRPRGFRGGRRRSLAHRPAPHAGRHPAFQPGHSAARCAARAASRPLRTASSACASAAAHRVSSRCMASQGGIRSTPSRQSLVGTGPADRVGRSRQPRRSFPHYPSGALP